LANPFTTLLSSPSGPRTDIAANALSFVIRFRWTIRSAKTNRSLRRNVTPELAKGHAASPDTKSSSRRVARCRVRAPVSASGVGADAARRSPVRVGHPPGACLFPHKLPARALALGRRERRDGHKRDWGDRPLVACPGLRALDLAMQGCPLVASKVNSSTQLLMQGGLDTAGCGDARGVLLTGVKPLASGGGYIDRIDR
jgi:hypothetical protein